MRAFEVMESHGPTHDLLLKLRKGMAASLNATKLASVFEVLNAETGSTWKVEKTKSYKLSDGGWVFSDILAGAAKKFDIGFRSRNTGRLLLGTALPRDADKYHKPEYRDDAVAKLERLTAIGESLKKLSSAPEKGKWFVRDVQMGTVDGNYGPQLNVSFELYVQTSGFIITSPEGQTYEVFGDYKNGAIGATTFASFFAWAVENTEIMDQILAVLQMEAHEKKHDPKARYTPPPGSPEETIRIFDLLKKLTDDVRAQQKDRLITAWKRAVMTFVTLLTGDDESRKKAKVMASGGHGYIIGQCIDTRAKDLREGWEKTIERLAEEQVEEMQNVFVYKNTRKLASIASSKGGMKEPKVINVNVDGGDIVATIDFSFDDGASFRVRQSVVFSTSNRGTPFYRFPTTFHDVILSDGSKMGAPSEERMNEIFAKA